MPELLIDKLTYGGSGFGRLDGKACFVPFTSPGDIIDVRIEKSKSSYSEGVVAELIQSSIHRSSPPCPVFGVCGGCNWQHISYEEQCRQKEHIFADILWRNARIASEKIRPILGADSPFEYRQRIQLKADYSGDRRSLGFHQRGTHDVIDINDHCEIAAKPLNVAIRKVREIIASFNEPDKITQVDLAAAADGSVSALFHYSGNRPEGLADHLAQTTENLTALHSISMKSVIKNSFSHIWGLDKLVYRVPSTAGEYIDLYFAPDSFSQVNFAQNRNIVQLLLDYCLKISPGSILDLFCGNGNFSLPLAGSVKKILGYESVKKSISLAQYNANVNKFENTRYLCKDSGAGIEALSKNSGSFELVIMDPPRSGAAEVCRIIHKTKCSHLIYISCDPPTLGRDLSILEQNGFAVIYIQPVDMFPQTYHLESVVFLKAI